MVEPRPFPEARVQLPHGTLGVVRGQPGNVGGVASAQEGRAEQVAPLLRFLQEGWQATRELGQLSQEEEQVEPDELSHQDLPDHPRAALAQDLLRPLTEDAPLAPASAEPGGDASDQRREADGVGLIHPLRDGLRRPEKALRPRAAPVPSHRDVSRLHGQGARDSIGLTGAKGEHQVAGLEVRPADHVHERHSDADRPAGVNPKQLLRGDLDLVALAKPQPAEPDLGPPQEEGDERPSGRFRQTHAQLREHGAQGPDPVFDVAADEELLCGAAVKVDREGGTGSLRRRQVRLRGLATPCRVGQGIPALDEQSSLVETRRRPETEGELVEARGTVERERLAAAAAYSAALSASPAPR